MRRSFPRCPLWGAVIFSWCVIPGCSEPTAPDVFIDDAAETYYLEFVRRSGGVEKWTRTLQVHWQGEPVSADVAALEEVVAELSHLLVTPRISMENRRSKANLHIYFVPDSMFSVVCPVEPSPYFGDQPCSTDAAGWAFIFAGGDHAIDSATVLIDTDWRGGHERLIRHALTHALGFHGHSWRHYGSILHANWTDGPAEYREIDRQMIRLHSRPGIRPGMNERAVREAIRLMEGG